ncbi:unnamed protein product [Prorocentrum cordatum]|uniref:Uncharacterized protein n=1 Tax=Prorocentrum cordatum TaxID=2364126 RepID=A0ABN9S9I0_9DINO|nr:unnamed protein product [Polarella glacialis]
MAFDLAPGAPDGVMSEDLREKQDEDQDEEQDLADEQDEEFAAESTREEDDESMDDNGDSTDFVCTPMPPCVSQGGHLISIPPQPPYPLQGGRIGRYPMSPLFDARQLVDGAAASLNERCCLVSPVLYIIAFCLI